MESNSPAEVTTGLDQLPLMAQTNSKLQSLLTQRSNRTLHCF